MSKTALLINDTSDAYHWGCHGTSSEIRAQLKERGYGVEAISVVDVQNIKPPPRKSDHVTGSTFHKAFLADNPELATRLENSDVVIINGEGTLHGLGQAAFNLLFLIALAKTACGKPVHLINTSVFPDDDGTLSPEVANFYKTVLNETDTMVVREPISAQLMGTCGIDATQGFDCLPLFLTRQTYTPEQSQEGLIVLGGGLGIKTDDFRELLERLVQQFPKSRFQYLTGAAGHPAEDDARLIQAAAGIQQFEHRDLGSFGEWVDAINRAACLVSGRFHHTIAASFLETPVVTFKAGTPKIDGLCDALNLQPPLHLTDSLAFDTAVARVVGCLAERPVVSAEHRDLCRQRASLNFDGL